MEGLGHCLFSVPSNSFPSLYLARGVTRLRYFHWQISWKGSCWWAAPSQGGGDPAFSFSKHASPSGLWGKYYVSIPSSHLLTRESPGNSSAGLCSLHAFWHTALPMHQSCFRLCAGCQGHTDKQDRHGFPTPEAVAHLSRFHPEISLRKSMLSKRAPAASAPPPDGVNKDSNTVVYPKESGRKPAQDFREVARYKINVYKQPAEVIMLAKIPFAMLTTKIKYFGINLTKKCAKPYKKKC